MIERLHYEDWPLLIIATGKYDRFLQSLIESADTHFSPTREVEYFVFTNHRSLNLLSDRRVHTLYIDHEPWPNPTLKRYDYFLSYSSVLENTDHLFYCDVDMRFVGAVGSEILGSRVGTIHPGFHKKPRRTWSYETRPKSCAYIASDQGSHYFAGGFVGGSTAEFLQMCSTISSWRKTDADNGIIPVWHDESLLNKYYILHQPSVVLNPNYCHPEKWKSDCEIKLLALDKNHKEMRSP